jgi:hypothetical protein
MKPRRDNGAVFVNPMTSAVNMGSARIRQFLRQSGRRIDRQVRRERKSPACDNGLSAAEKKSMQRGIKQGRRRSMPPTTLPAPEIEIGSRLPVNYILPRFGGGKCEPVHILQKSCGGGDKPDGIGGAKLATLPASSAI